MILRSGGNSIDSVAQRDLIWLVSGHAERPLGVFHGTHGSGLGRGIIAMPNAFNSGGMRIPKTQLQC